MTTQTHTFIPRGVCRDLFETRAPEVLISGPAGCVAGETELWDPIHGVGQRIDKLCRLRIRPWVQTLAGPVLADVPFLKGVAPLYRVTLADGSSCLATGDHLFLTASGWTAAALLTPGSFVLSGSPTDESRCPGTGGGSWDGCRRECRLCDPLLPSGSVADLAFVPSLSDAHEPGCERSPLGGPASTAGHTRPCPTSDHLATPGSDPLPSSSTSSETLASPRATRDAQSPSGSGTHEPGSLLSQPRHRSRSGSPQPQPSLSLSHGASRTHPLGRAVSMSNDLGSCSHYRSRWVPVTGIAYERTDVYYDLHVPGEQHYLAEGTWSHNTGKSRACLEKIHAIALANPGARCLMVRKTAESLKTTALVTWKRDVIPETEAAGVVTYYGGSRERPAAYEYTNGSTVVMGGMDKPSKIMSSEWDICYVQEATELEEADWEAITTRLRSDMVSFQQIIADTNPSTPTHWLAKRCARGVTVLLESRHEDNPTLFDDAGAVTDRGAAYISKLDALTGTRYQRLRLGKWVGQEGIVYPEYDPAVHLIDAAPIPADLNRYWVIDFGFVNPMVVQCWAEMPDGELVMYREFYGTGRLVSEWAAEILDVVTDDDGAWTEPRPVAIIADHDAEGRETFARIIGQQTVPAIKKVLDGIEAVKVRLNDKRILFQRDALHAVDETLRDSSRPVTSAEEFGGYIWADGKLKEQPVKRDDHGLDCVRYVVAQIDLGARPGVRWI